MLNLPASQKKKLRQKQKKAEARAKKVILIELYTCINALFWNVSFSFLLEILQEAEERNDEETTSGTSKSGKRQNARPVDLDPHGEKLLQVLNFTFKFYGYTYDFLFFLKV